MADIFLNDMLNSSDENDWHSWELIKSIACIAALFHDLGKSVTAFQGRITGKLSGKNLIRHEWVSLRLFEAFVDNRSDPEWLADLSTLDADISDLLISKIKKDFLDERENLASPFASMGPLAKAVGWLIISHHRLPTRSSVEKSARWGQKIKSFNANELTGYAEQLNNVLEHIDSPLWNELIKSGQFSASDFRDDLQNHWCFRHGLPLTKNWLRKARVTAMAAQRCGADRKQDEDFDLYVLHMARLCLMQGDQYYSGAEKPHERLAQHDKRLWANTYPAGKRNKLKQTLDEHTLGVFRETKIVSSYLSSLKEVLPALGKHDFLGKRTPDKRFEWQNKAFDLCFSVREKSYRQGFFGVQMASTGTGKTVANGKIAYALSRPEEGLRVSIALGLRTLTLQTGTEYREMLGLDDRQLAVRVGGQASKSLFEHYEAQAEATGSSSNAETFTEDEHVFYEGNASGHPMLEKMESRGDRKFKAMLSAPILSCTVDHLVPATESLKGGRQIPPMLRLMTADLVLDEIDDYGLSDMPALTRLVFFAGMLGSRVILSSATLPPNMVKGLFDAYYEGRVIYERKRDGEAAEKGVVCAWFDEHDSVSAEVKPDQFKDAHQRFVDQRKEAIEAQAPRRTGYLVPMPERGQYDNETLYDMLAHKVIEQAESLHAHNRQTDPVTGAEVSFGLVRFANIGPLVEIAKRIYAQGPISEDVVLHLRTYHSRFPLLMRSEIEHVLDKTLKRKDEQAIFNQSCVRRHLDRLWASRKKHIFIVIGSPVTEVGRDHDYDWAIVEPSSLRSMIQLVGRIRRHRNAPWSSPNVAILSKNVRAMKQSSGAAYQRPGFEQKALVELAEHDLSEIVEPSVYKHLNAVPRITTGSIKRNDKHLLEKKGDGRIIAHDLGLLEHCAVMKVMTQPSSCEERRADAAYWPLISADLLKTGLLQQQQVFRESSGVDEDLLFSVNEEADALSVLKLNDPQKTDQEGKWIGANHRVELDEVHAAQGVDTWFADDYVSLLNRKAEQMKLHVKHFAYKFGGTSVPVREDGKYRFHEDMGLY